MDRSFFRGEFKQLTCCGVREYWGINSRAFEDVRDIAIQYAYKRANTGLAAAHILINEVTNHASYGPGDRLPKFAALCAANGLGQVIMTRPKLNPNSGNDVRGALWSPTRDVLSAWAKRQPEYDVALRALELRLSHWRHL